MIGQWYRRCVRWGQTNITEIDPLRYDIEWWRGHWRRTRVQGIIVNAGGIVAYYPSGLPLQYRARHLGERDLFAEITDAARKDGLAVLARMDTNRCHEDFYRAHPSWFCVDKNGTPYRAGELYLSCVNSPYYTGFIPDVFREIIERYHPDGFADNSWSGLDRSRICYCENCSRAFRQACGEELPAEKNWDSAVYRTWIEWNYARRLELWDENNRVTTGAGGAECLWIGMNGANLSHQCSSFRDVRGVCQRAGMLLLDAQSRDKNTGFQVNADAGKLMHGVLGWDKLIPESMAMYVSGVGLTFRHASRHEPEARMWMIEGIAGGIQPWWHHVGAYHDDRRQYHSAERVCAWHEKHQEFLVERTPVATVGLVWSQRSVDFHGRDNAEEVSMLPYRGMMQALIRARIPYVPVNIDDIDTCAATLALLILPNVGAMSQGQCDRVKRFVRQGGGCIASGETSLYDEHGVSRGDFGLAEVFGVHATAAHYGSHVNPDGNWATYDWHSYLRLLPQMCAAIDGPHYEGEPAASGQQHTVLDGFDLTDSLPFGGRQEIVSVEGGATVPATFIKPFPVYPPETSWTAKPATPDASVVIRETAGHGRVAYLAADIDRCFCRENQPDHGDLLANIVRWTSGGRIPLAVQGAGCIDCQLYRQPGRMILHIVNLSSAGSWRPPLHELIKIGPLKVRVQLCEGVRGDTARLLVAEGLVPGVKKDGWVEFTVQSIFDHEVVVIS